MARISTSSTEEFVGCLDQLSMWGASLPQRELRQAIEDLQGQGLTPWQWGKVVAFAGDQHSRWLTDWLFSPAATPNTHAAGEAQSWEQLWTACAQALAADVPEAVEPLRRQKNLMAATRALERKERLDRASSSAKLAFSIVSRLGILLGRVGLRHLGRSLYSRALYPAGSVGRAMGANQPA